MPQLNLSDEDLQYILELLYTDLELGERCFEDGVPIDLSEPQRVLDNLIAQTGKRPIGLMTETGEAARDTVAKKLGVTIPPRRKPS